MKIKELEQKLQEINVPKEVYSILKGGFPIEQYCITKNGDDWEVYYSERGNKSGLKTFDVEERACEYFYKKVSKHAKIK